MPIKSTTTTVGEGGRKIKKNLQNKSKHKNNKCLSWVIAVSVLSLTGSRSLPHLPRMASNTGLVSGPAVGAAQILIWSYSCVFLPLMSTELVCFLLWQLSMFFYLFHRHTVCLVGCVHLICCLYTWWEDSGSSSLATLPLGFNCGFLSTSACGSSTGV